MRVWAEMRGDSVEIRVKRGCGVKTRREYTSSERIRMEWRTHSDPIARSPEGVQILPMGLWLGGMLGRGLGEEGG